MPQVIPLPAAITTLVAAYAALMNQRKYGYVGEVGFKFDWKTWGVQRDTRMEAMEAAGLMADWRPRNLHPTHRVGELGEQKFPLQVDDDGGLWAHVVSGQGQDAPGYYARIGQIEGAGPLIPVAITGPRICLQIHRCDCGYSSAAILQVWGDPVEQQAARAAMLEELTALLR